jgi:hypothetical protein
MSDGEDTCRGYAGAGWIKAAQRKPMSEFGEKVADLLGDLFLGIYHIADDVRRADWTTDRWITLTIVGNSWATWDGSNLTRLVVLAHDRCIRVEMEAVAPRTMRLTFSPREGRNGPTYKRHPTMEQAVVTHRTS